MTDARSSLQGVVGVAEWPRLNPEGASAVNDCQLRIESRRPRRLWTGTSIFAERQVMAKACFVAGSSQPGAATRERSPPQR